MKKILIVDDEPLVRRSLSRIFAKKYTVLEAENGKEGLEIWRQQKPDLVFLDVLMPILSGPQVLQELTELEKEATFIILMSAYSGEHDLDSAQDMGARLFLPKPFDDIFKISKLVDETLV